MFDFVDTLSKTSTFYNMHGTPESRRRDVHMGDDAWGLESGQGRGRWYDDVVRETIKGFSPMLIRPILICILVLILAPFAHAAEPVPDKTVVLTFDDAVKSHITTVGPMLKELGFGATFFITHLWMNDSANFLSWEDCKTLHEMGFEIGNHSWTHADFSQPANAARLEAELALVTYMLGKQGIPKPVSFAWCGNGFGPMARQVLADAGYSYARRGMQPEVEYGLKELGPVYRPADYDPLLIPTSGDAYPNWDFDHFVRVVERARDGNVVVLQFHGVPDPVHPWVNTDPALFRQCMAYLKDNGYRAIALRDVAAYIHENAGANDPMRTASNPTRDAAKLVWPPEVVASRADAAYWLANMREGHGFTDAEIERVFQWPSSEWPKAATLPATTNRVRVLPYPGGRHPRLGFLDGMVAPMRGTKASVFAPWADGGYAVLDLPEAIFSNLGLLFLGHTHIPTIWDDANVAIPNQDWTQDKDGNLSSEWLLPNKVRINAYVRPQPDGAWLEMFLHNDTGETLTGLRTQVCLMLGRLAGFEALSQENKVYTETTAGARSADGKRWVYITFENAGRIWGNEKCPCVHSDPVFPDCGTGQTAIVDGWLWFHEGEGGIAEAERGRKEFEDVLNEVGLN